MTRAKLVIPSIFLTLGIFFSQNVTAAEFSTRIVNLRHYNLFSTLYVREVRMDGYIVQGDDAILNDIIEKYQYGGQPIRVIVLNSEGGDLNEAYEMAETISHYNISTLIDRNKSCSAACFTLFLGGKNRFIYPESTVVLNNTSVDGDFNNPLAIEAKEKLLESYKQSNVPLGVIKKFKHIQGGEKYKLSHDNMRGLDNMSFDFAPETEESIAAMKEDLAKIEKNAREYRSSVDDLLENKSSSKNKH